ncbi:MarR family winged helix-turn-helix transcriptional regulator [Streptomyces olivaceus]|uniref:MarR family winged helix-turn-helix transcriptional regulator n=1 Tax=Streptomyces olivaceus TaxID=47716 RepID=UPI003F4B1444
MVAIAIRRRSRGSCRAGTRRTVRRPADTGPSTRDLADSLPVERDGGYGTSGGKRRFSTNATRMEARGLIRRAPDPDDGRGCLLVLTETGLDTLRQAAPAHVASVRRHFIDQLDPQELTVLGRIAANLAREPEDSA